MLLSATAVLTGAGGVSSTETIVLGNERLRKCIMPP